LVFALSAEKPKPPSRVRTSCSVSLGRKLCKRLDRRQRTVEFFQLMLREIAGHSLRERTHRPPSRELSGQQFRQRRFAVAVLAQKRDAVVGIEAQEMLVSTGFPGS
jgi:hypothetical protein